VTTKTFDCVQMKRSIQERINRETAGMSSQERDEFIRQKAEAFLRELASRPGKEGFASIADSMIGREPDNR